MPRYRITFQRTPGSGTRRSCSLGRGSGSITLGVGKAVDVTITPAQARSVAEFVWFKVEAISNEKKKPSPLDENPLRKKLTKKKTQPKRKAKAKETKE